MRFVVAALLAGFASAGAQAVTVVNASFENGPSTNGGLVELAAGDTLSLPGWTVRANGVSVAEAPFWTASDGNRSIRLATSDGGGGVFQRINGFATGQLYRLSFDLAGDPYDPAVRPNDKRVVVSATGGVAQLFTFSLTDASTPASPGWQRYEYLFRAGGDLQTIQFRGASPDQYGPLLDNVSLAVVPEPASWAMLIVGFGMVGAARRRQRSVVA